MEEEMLEQTNEPAEETANVEQTTEIIVEEQPTEPMYTKSQMQEEINNAVENRLARERKKLDREYKESLSKYQELGYLTQQGLKADSLDDTLEKARKFYGEQGITYVPQNDDDKIVGKAYAEEIISEADSLKELEDTANRLSSKVNLSNRDKIILENLNSEIESRRKIALLEANGVTEEEYNSQEFKDFVKKYSNSDTPIMDLYNMYKRVTDVKPVENPGSMKSVPGKEKQDFISEAEYDKMSDKEIEENLDLIRKSMEKW